jgi:hypothetical protein
MVKRNRSSTVKKPPQRIQVGPGLDGREAMRRAKRRATRDFRGAKYDKRTGWMILT